MGISGLGYVKMIHRIVWGLIKNRNKSEFTEVVP